MREIIFDTETTGLDPSGDRLIEIGAVELINRFPTGRSYHCFINPAERKVHPDAFAVHGISDDFLKDKPLFADIWQELDEFFGDAMLVAHNASFDIGFLNAECGRMERPHIEPARIVDTLALARRRHPGAKNSLDALCQRYGIDNARRIKHGALLDAELLAEVYIEMSGGRQAALILGSGEERTATRSGGNRAAAAVTARPEPLPPRLSEAEIAAHQAMVASLGDNALWSRIIKAG